MKFKANQLLLLIVVAIGFWLYSKNKKAAAASTTEETQTTVVPTTTTSPQATYSSPQTSTPSVGASPGSVILNVSAQGGQGGSGGVATGGSSTGTVTVGSPTVGNISSQATPIQRTGPIIQGITARNTQADPVHTLSRSQEYARNVGARNYGNLS